MTRYDAEKDAYHCSYGIPSPGAGGARPGARADRARRPPQLPRRRLLDPELHRVAQEARRRGGQLRRRPPRRVADGADRHERAPLRPGRATRRAGPGPGVGLGLPAPAARRARRAAGAGGAAAARSIADTTGALRVLETSHPPTFYLPLADVAAGRARARRRGRASASGRAAAAYLDVVGGRPRRPARRLVLPVPVAAVRGSSPGTSPSTRAGWTPVWSDEERVAAQEGDFYGGWITDEIVGPFKGGAGHAGLVTRALRGARPGRAAAPARPPEAGHGVGAPAGGGRADHEDEPAAAGRSAARPVAHHPHPPAAGEDDGARREAPQA